MDGNGRARITERAWRPLASTGFSPRPMSCNTDRPAGPARRPFY